MIVKDQQPISIVEDKGFQELLEHLAPRYQLVSRSHLSNAVIPAIYDDVKSKVLDIIHQTQSVSFTTDGWTSRSNTSYLTVTAHVLDIDWKLHAFVLATNEVGESHTATNLASHLQTVLQDWLHEQSVYVKALKSESADPGLPGITPTVTTDNAANIVKGMKLCCYHKYL